MKRQKVKIDGKIIVTRAKTWFNHNGKRHKIADYPIDKDNKSEGSPVNGGNITTKITSETEVPEITKIPENIKDKEKVKLPAVTGDTKTQIIYNDRDGSFTIAQGEEVSDMPKEPKTENPEPKAGGGQDMKTAPETRKLDIDRKEDVLDNFFSRGVVETLVPVGLLVAGFMMKKETEPGNAEYGENVRKHGMSGGWLNGGGSNNDW